MSKNHKNKEYRKIYEKHFGKIPKGMHIHHVDGNPENNNIDNLVCITPEEHSIIHKDDFIKWACIGGKIGGDKTKNQKLGWHDPAKKRKPGSKQPQGFSQNQSKRLKEEYLNGKRVSWTKSGKFTKEEISNLISSGDPGKSSRGKPSCNRGKKLNLKNKELANKRKSQAALNRKKYTCIFCEKSFDGGNFTQHMLHKHEWEKEKILNFKTNHE
jgi:hypothetical protein